MSLARDIRAYYDPQTDSLSMSLNGQKVYEIKEVKSKIRRGFSQEPRSKSSAKQSSKKRSQSVINIPKPPKVKITPKQKRITPGYGQQKFPKQRNWKQFRPGRFAARGQAKDDVQALALAMIKQMHQKEVEAEEKKRQEIRKETRKEMQQQIKDEEVVGREALLDWKRHQLDSGNTDEVVQTIYERAKRAFEEYVQKKKDQLNTTQFFMNPSNKLVDFGSTQAELRKQLADIFVPQDIDQLISNIQYRLGGMQKIEQEEKLVEQIRKEEEHQKTQILQNSQLTQIFGPKQNDSDLASYEAIQSAIPVDQQVALPATESRINKSHLLNESQNRTLLQQLRPSSFSQIVQYPQAFQYPQASYYTVHFPGTKEYEEQQRYKYRLMQNDESAIGTIMEEDQSESEASKNREFFGGDSSDEARIEMYDNEPSSSQSSNVLGSVFSDSLHSSLVTEQQLQKPTTQEEILGLPSQELNRQQHEQLLSSTSNGKRKIHITPETEQHQQQLREAAEELVRSQAAAEEQGVGRERAENLHKIMNSLSQGEQNIARRLQEKQQEQEQLQQGVADVLRQRGPIINTEEAIKEQAQEQGGPMSQQQIIHMLEQSLEPQPQLEMLQRSQDQSQEERKSEALERAMARSGVQPEQIEQVVQSQQQTNESILASQQSQPEELVYVPNPESIYQHESLREQAMAQIEQQQQQQQQQQQMEQQRKNISSMAVDLGDATQLEEWLQQKKKEMNEISSLQASMDIGDIQFLEEQLKQKKKQHQEFLKDLKRREQEMKSTRAIVDVGDIKYLEKQQKEINKQSQQSNQQEIVSRPQIPQLRLGSQSARASTQSLPTSPRATLPLSSPRQSVGTIYIQTGDQKKAMGPNKANAWRALGASGTITRGQYNGTVFSLQQMNQGRSIDSVSYDSLKKVFNNSDLINRLIIEDQNNKNRYVFDPNYDQFIKQNIGTILKQGNGRTQKLVHKAKRYIGQAVESSSEESDSDERGGLYDYEIDKYLNTHVANNYKQGLLKTSAYNANIKIPILQDTTIPIMFVMNTDKMSEHDNDHWFSIYIDRDQKQICLFDSSGITDGRQSKLIENIVNQLDQAENDGIAYKIKKSSTQIQDLKNNYCGEYAAEFLLRMLDSGGNFEFSSWYKKPIDHKGRILAEYFQKSFDSM